MIAPTGTAISRPTATAHRLVDASVSANTRGAYAGALGQLDAWLDGRRLDDAALAAYLTCREKAKVCALSARREIGRCCGSSPPLETKHLVRFHLTLPPAVRREQPLRAHHAQHPRPGDSDPVEDPQPRVDLAMALTLER